MFVGRCGSSCSRGVTSYRTSRACRWGASARDCWACTATRAASRSSSCCRARPCASSARTSPRTRSDSIQFKFNLNSIWIRFNRHICDQGLKHCQDRNENARDIQQGCAVGNRACDLGNQFDHVIWCDFLFRKLLNWIELNRIKSN